MLDICAREAATSPACFSPYARIHSSGIRCRASRHHSGSPSPTVRPSTTSARKQVISPPSMALTTRQSSHPQQSAKSGLPVSPAR